MQRKILQLSLMSWIVVASSIAHAQWDIRGCSQYGVSINNPASIESSLWTFRSNVWDGYIDFQENGKYWTHWGYGTWKINPDGETIRLANDYNDKTYQVSFTDSGFRFEGYGSDGLVITGKLICSKYQGPGPQVPDEIVTQLNNLFKVWFEREPTKEEIISMHRLYAQGNTVDEISEKLKQLPEYIQKQAAREEKLRQMEANGELQW